MLDLHTTKHGYKEVYPPFMVKRECMVGSGNLPKFADNLYHDEEDDFWFVPTAEVPSPTSTATKSYHPGFYPYIMSPIPPAFAGRKCRRERIPGA
jgi:seryl-tRNA synthetase